MKFVYLIVALFFAALSIAQAEEVTIPNSGGGTTLAATFSDGAGRGPYPVVVLICGSGPNSRGGFTKLIETLNARGIATIEFDKRGTGKSTGDFSKAALSDFASDAAAVVAYLKTRIDVDKTHIGILGTSEGSIIAAEVAEHDSGIGFVILAGAMGLNGREFMLSMMDGANRAAGMTEADMAKAHVAASDFMQAILAAQTDAEALSVAKAHFGAYVAEKKLTQQQADALAADAASHAARENIGFDPAGSLRHVKAPVLVITGTLDRQLPASIHFPSLRAALKDNSDATFIEVEGINHVFQRAKTGDISEWQTLGPPFAAPEANDAIADWLERRLNARHRS